MTGPGCTTGRPVCGKPARLYPAGWRCPAHTPAAVAGRPEPPPGPGWPPDAWNSPQAHGTGALIDQRAIATGKRRAAPHTYRAAQAATRPLAPRKPIDDLHLPEPQGDAA